MAEKLDASLAAFPCRAEGWLNVWEIARWNEQNGQLEGSVPLVIWEPCFCVLLQYRCRLAHFRSEKQADEAYKNGDSSQKRVRIDRGKDEFDQRWGYTALESIKENVMQHEYGTLSSLEAFQQRSLTFDTRSITSQCSDSAYEKGCGGGGLGERRGSVPVVSADDDVMDTPSTPSRIANFFSKKVKSNLKRTKSVTKLDRRKGGSSYNHELEGSSPEQPRKKASSSLRRSLSLGRLTRRKIPARDSLTLDRSRDDSKLSELAGALINHRIRASRSHESLLQINTPTSMHSIDLSAQDIEIKPLHSSILGQEHCFQVSTSNGSKFYSCRSAEEREKWIQHLRKTVQPAQEQTRRTENSLKLWILEAKNVPTKKRYFCELCLDGTLYARTSSKTKGDMLFWGEQFDFNNLPPVKNITINLYKEADKKKKKDKNMLLAYVNIPVNEVNKRNFVERWYTASSAIVGKAGKDSKTDLPLLRIKARYQTVQILPMDLYQDLLEYVEKDYCTLVEILEPQISVKAKEEFATTLVHVLQKRGLACDFLSDIVIAEVDKLENENLTFRGNSIATKSMEAFLKLIGDKYLQDTLSDFIKTMLESGDDCEVDSVKVPNNANLLRQQKNLTMYCEMAWFKIVNSHCFFPSELRTVFNSFKECCEERKRGDLADNLISSCIFLRFLCPAILSPSLFNLTQEFPNERGARNLTLVAKTIQCLANFTKFGGKEEFMTFMNDFVENELSNAKMFIQQISNPEPRDDPVEFDGFIDLGKELSLLHTLLVENMEKVNDAAGLKLSRLKTILDDISAALLNPQIVRRHPLNRSKGIYDNVNLVSEPQDQNANTSADVVLTDLTNEYRDAELSRTNDTQFVHRNKYSENLYSRTGRMRTGVTEVSSNFQSTEDYVRYTNVEEIPIMTQVSVMQSSYTSKRPEEKQVNRCWDKMVKAAEMVNGDRVDLITFVDDTEDLQNSSLDSADQVSVSQLSTVASSGYQSIGYSQSSSPVEPLAHSDPNQQPLSFANPLFCHSTSVNGATAGKSEETIFRSPPTMSRDGMYRSPSTSSLSSDDGGIPRSPYPGAISNTTPHNGLTTYSSSQTTPSQASTVRSLDRRLRTGSSSSADSLPPAQDDRQHRLHRQCAQHRPYHSPRLSKSQPRVNANTPSVELRIPPSPVLAATDLSRSVDFTHSTPGIKRTMTDSVLQQGVHVTGIYTPPESPHFGTLPPTWRTPTQHQTVRMGIRSVNQKQQQPISRNERSKEEYEQELNLLRQQLANTQTMLEETQIRLSKEEEVRQRLVSDMHSTVNSRQVALEEQASDKDNQMQNVMSRLHSVEQNRRCGQDALVMAVSQKQRVIDEQESRIQSLDAANNKLLNALSQLKDRCQIPSRNGTMRPHLSLADEDEIPHSSC